MSQWADMDDDDLGEALRLRGVSPMTVDRAVHQRKDPWWAIFIGKAMEKPAARGQGRLDF